MNRRLFLLFAVLLACLASAATIELARGHEATGSVFSLSRVQEGVAHQPKAWVGHTVLLRARLLSSPIPVGPSRSDPSGSTMGYPLLPATGTQGPRRSGAPDGSRAGGGGRMLVLVRQGEEPLIHALRHAPLLGQMMPAPQTLDFFHEATYRVRLQAAPTTSMACVTRPCYEAVLLDAAPWPSLRYTNFLH